MSRSLTLDPTRGTRGEPGESLSSTRTTTGRPTVVDTVSGRATGAAALPGSPGRAGRVVSARLTTLAAFRAWRYVCPLAFAVSVSVVRPSRSGGMVLVARQVVLAPGARGPPRGTGEQTSAESPGNGARTSRLRSVTFPLFRATNVYATGWVAVDTVDGSTDAVSASLGSWMGLGAAVGGRRALVGGA